MWRTRERLLLPAVSFAAGILAAACIGIPTLHLCAGLLALSIVCAVAWWRAPGVSWLATVALAVTAGALVYQVRRTGPAPELVSSADEPVLVEGCVVDPGTAEEVQTRFTVQLEPGANVRATLIARDNEQLPPVPYGSIVEFEAKLRKPRNFGNPGAFDYVRYLHRQQIFWTTSVRGVEKLRFIEGKCGSNWRKWSFAVREWIANRLKQVCTGDSYSSRLIPALLLGDNSNLERSWTEDFRRTGTYHAIVISGLHITVVAGAALFLLRVAGVPLGWMLGISGFLAWGYAAVANFQAPVVRSAAGFTLFLIARWLFRSGRVLNLLAAIAIALLAWDPDQLFEPSFQLTFLSVAAIGALSSPLIERSFGPYRTGVRGIAHTSHDFGLAPKVAQFRIEMRLVAETAALCTGIPASIFSALIAAVLRVWFWALEMMTISCCVQLCLALALITYFHQMSVTSVAANVFIVPALTLAVPVAFVAGLTSFMWIGSAAGALVRWAGFSAAWWAALEPSWRVPDPPLWAAVLAAMCVTCLALTVLAGTRMRWILVSSAVAVGVLALLVWYPFPPLIEPGSLEMTAIDVGQGESILLSMPDGQLILVDAGGIPVFDPRRKPRLEIGEDVVSPYLWYRRIKRLDIVATTHLHDDHAGGLPAVIRNFRPREVWTGATADCRLLQEINAAARSVGARVLRPEPGAARRFGEATVQVLAPPLGYEPRNLPANNDSLVLEFSHGRHRFLLTGDIEQKIEQTLIASGRLPEVDVLKIAHHGSRNSTAPEFLNQVRPLFTLISAGAGNLYGHPHPELVERLYRAGARVFRTDVDGLTVFRTDGRRLSTERALPSWSVPAWEKTSN